MPILKNTKAITEIPWEDIDSEIKPLIKELNRLGLKTTGSCEGHQHKEKGRRDSYIAIDMNCSSITVVIQNNRLAIHWNRGNGNTESDSSLIGKSE